MYTYSFHIVLLRSDGHAVARGDNLFGACDIVPPESGNSYCHVDENLPLCDLVLQVEFLREDDQVTFHTLNSGSKRNMTPQCTWIRSGLGYSQCHCT